MLLIHCDIFKASWNVGFQTVQLLYGTVKSGSKFCHAGGFFFALAIELTDLAVLMIALHTALYIFRGDQGLYPFRRYAYAVFVSVPILLASLAFVNKEGYVNTGNQCYLPINPSWLRKALSWIPRYLTLGTILLTYLAVYIYIRILMRQFGKSPSSAQLRNEDISQDISLLEGTTSSSGSRKPDTLIPETPSLAYHGLIPSTTVSNRTSRDLRGRQFSVISTISTLNMDHSTNKQAPHNLNSSRKQDAAVRWRTPNFSLEVPSFNERLESEPCTPTAANYNSDEITLTTPTEAHLRESHESPSSSSSTTPVTRPATAARDFRSHSIAGTSTTMPSRTPSDAGLYSAIRPEGDNHARPKAGSVFLPSSTTPLDATTVLKTREKVRRQLRGLFVYPLVYVIVWVLPFIIYHTGYGRAAPFGLICASMVLLGLQGFANALIFSLKEKPWRHPRKKKPCSYAAWKRGERELFDFKFWNRPRRQEPNNPKVGRTRDEMMLDGRHARKRREVELEDRRLELQNNRKVRKDWWDQEDHDDQV